MLDEAPCLLVRFDLVCADRLRLRGIIADVETALWALDGRVSTRQDYDEAVSLLRVEGLAIREEESNG
jgi:hypothetical protein